LQDSAPTGPRRPDTEERSPGLSPVRAFFLLGAVATIVPLTFLATRPEASPSPTAAPSRSPDFSLTEAEAIAEFEELRDLALDAIRNRDASRVDEAFVPTGPAATRALGEIRKLLRARVTDESTFFSKSVKVVENSPRQIRIVERSRLKPCFRTANARDVSEGPAVVDQTSLWTMRQVNTQWRIYDVVLRRDAVISKASATCG
jgi:hypothetical protein